MANLDGTRGNGGKRELDAAARLGDVELTQGVYVRILNVARSFGIDRDQLPDFLGLDDGDRFELKVQYELNSSDVESLLADALDT